MAECRTSLQWWEQDKFSPELTESLGSFSFYGVCESGNAERGTVLLSFVEVSYAAALKTNVL